MRDLFGDWILDMKYDRCDDADLDGIPVVTSPNGVDGLVGYEIYLRDPSRGDGSRVGPRGRQALRHPRHAVVGHPAHRGRHLRLGLGHHAHRQPVRGDGFGAPGRGARGRLHREGGPRKVGILRQGVTRKLLGSRSRARRSSSPRSTGPRSTAGARRPRHRRVLVAAPGEEHRYVCVPIELAEPGMMLESWTSATGGHHRHDIRSSTATSGCPRRSHALGGSRATRDDSKMTADAEAQHLRDLARLRRVRDRMTGRCVAAGRRGARARRACRPGTSRQFREAYGEPPYSYLMTRRIERAMALLLRDDLSVTEVCFAVRCCRRHLQHPLHRVGRGRPAERLPAAGGGRDRRDGAGAWRSR